MQGTSWGQSIAGFVWGVTAVSCSLMDWPVRNLTKGKLLGAVYPVRSSTLVSASVKLHISL